VISVFQEGITDRQFERGEDFVYAHPPYPLPSGCIWCTFKLSLLSPDKVKSYMIHFVMCHHLMCFKYFRENITDKLTHPGKVHKDLNLEKVVIN
jgi:hypothetical protein